MDLQVYKSSEEFNAHKITDIMQKQQETRYYKNEIYGEQNINDGQGF